ncbi:transmembrane protein 205 [Fagus crenata]
MMNLLALSLVVTSLAAAGVWSPTPELKQKQGDDVIVKDGHRVIVVEYDQGGQHNTKVSISPEHHHVSHKPATEGGISSMEEKIKEASSVLPNLGQGLSQPPETESNISHTNPKELICDAFGKCKHKIVSAMRKAKDKVSDKEKEVGDAFGKAKETASKKAHKVEESAKEIGDVMDKVKTAKEKGKTIKEDIARNVSDKVEMAKEKVVEKAKETAAYKVKTQKELRGVLRRGREVGHDAVNYAMGSLMGLVNLMGFATAYGMCVWVTFISSHVLAETMPRQQFGMVQSKIYPVYFRAMAGSIGFALLGHLLGNRKRLFSSKVEMFQGYNLLATLFMVFLNLLYLEPRASKVMFKRMKLQKEEGRGIEDLTADSRQASESQPVADPGVSTTTTTTAPAVPSPASKVAEQEVVRSRIVKLNDRLKTLNTFSSFLNILTLMALTWHLVYLGQRLHLAC